MKNIKKLVAMLIAVVMLLGIIPTAGLAQAEPSMQNVQSAMDTSTQPTASPSTQPTASPSTQPTALPTAPEAIALAAPVGSVFVTVENMTYKKSAGALWEGKLVDHQEIPITSESTMMSAVVAALDGISATQTGADKNYISSINGLEQMAAGANSGWMGTLNDWFGNVGFGDFTVARGTLGDGDEISLMYSVTGSDIGASAWGGPTETTVKALNTSTGTLSPAFDKGTNAYTLNVSADISAVKITPTATDKNFQVHTSVAGTEYKRSQMIPIDNGTVITVKCGDPSWPTMNTGSFTATTYTLTVNKSVVPVVTFQVTPADAAIFVADANGQNIPASKNLNEFTLEAGKAYTYTVSKYGYITQHAAITANGPQTITAELAAAPANTLTKYDSQWPSFRNSLNNMGIVSAKTPRTASNSELKWATKMATGYGNPVSSPIIVGDKLYVMVGSTIKKVDKATGVVEATTGTAVASGGFTVQLAYGEGMIFAPIGNGRIQAFDANTLQSLWVSEQLGGQTLTPITYADGYVYTGFSSNGASAAYVCLAVTDEEPANTNEVKYPTWVKKAPAAASQGYYWSGACVIGNAVVFGVDSGLLTSYSTTQNKEIDTFQVEGDIRSSIAKDKDRIYFTTKTGKVFSIQMNADGTFNDASVKSGQAVGVSESTSTPVVYNGRIYVGGSGASFKEGTVAVMNATDMSTIYSAKTGGKVQSSALFSTAYNAETGKVYAYFTYNNKPGGITVFEDSVGQTTAQMSELFVPEGDKVQFCICSLIADSDGTIYYKNDSGYLMAVGSKPNNIPTRKTGVAAAIDASVVFGSAYTLDLSTIFEDANGEVLTYSVSINDAPAVNVAQNYSYTAAEKGTVKLVFKANDGKADSVDTYTVNLTTEKLKLTAGSVERTSDTSAKVRFTANQSGTSYYQVVQSGAPLPAIDTSGMGVAAVLGENTILIDTLSAGAKDIYVVVKGENGDVSEPIKVEALAYLDMSAKLIENPQLSTGIFWTPLFEKERSGAARFAFANVPIGTENLIFTFKAPQGIEVYDGANVKLTPDINGIYTMNIAVTSEADNAPNYMQGKGGQTATFRMQYGVQTAEYRVNVIRRPIQAGMNVIDYLCVGSQYTNNANYGLYPERTLAGENGWNTPVSVGGFGGYVTYQFDTPIKNDTKNPYGIDLVIYGNGGASQSFSEPGNVLVSKDGNNWYALAGSDYFDDNTEWNYELTYTTGVNNKINWTDKYQNTGTMQIGKNPPTNENYPLAKFDAAQPIKVSGTLLKDKATDAYGANGMAAFPQWGYADVHNTASTDGKAGNPYTGTAPKTGDLFDLSWAVDSSGKAVKLDSINYVKVQTASHIDAGMFGEKSTEVNAVKAAQSAAGDVGTTAAPSKITINGKEVKLQNNKMEYGAYFGAGEVTVDVSVPVGTNVYINKTYGNSYTYTAAPLKGIIRVIVQEGEKQPLIYYIHEQTEAQALPEIKTDAKAEIEGYKNAADYRTAQQSELAGAIANGKTAIENAADIAGVESAKTAAKSAMDAIKTDVQMTAEELSAAKIDAKAELAGYKKADDYRTSERAILAQKVTEGKTAIENAVDVAGVNSALLAAKTEIDKIKTDAQLTAEENSAAAKAVDDKITAIGAVTLASKANIDIARLAYDGLNSAQKLLVVKLDVLKTAETKYAELKAAADKLVVDSAAAKAVDDKITAIGAATLEKEAVIQNARTAYEALSKDQKALIKGYAALIKAESTLEVLKTEKLIDAIGSPVTFADQKTIEAAQKEYTALSDVQKTQIKAAAVDKLENAKLAMEKLSKELDKAVPIVKTTDGIKLEPVKAGSIVLSDAEKTAVANGAKLNLIMEAKQMTAQATGPDAQAVQSALGSGTVAGYFDINLFKKIGEGSRTAVSETGVPLRFVINVAEEWKTVGDAVRKFYVIRVHDGVAQRLEDLDNNPNTITLESAEYSTYAVAYEDQKAGSIENENGTANDAVQQNKDAIRSVKTGDAQNIWIYILLAMAAIGSICVMVIYKKRKKA
ncbi:MAG: DUF4430 domain-containing protein [Christensenellaceae bacterium]